MAVNNTGIWHGWELFIGTGAASPAKISTGGAKVGNILNVGGEFGPMAKESVSEPLDADSVVIAKGILDYGTVEFTYLAKDNDTGQSAANTASKHASFKYPVYASNGTDNIQFVGFVLTNSNSGGSGGDFIQKKMTLRLTEDVA